MQLLTGLIDDTADCRYFTYMMKTDMRRHLIYALLLMIVAGCNKNNPDKPVTDKNNLAWEKMGEFPGYIRIEAAGFWIGEKFYTGMGFGYLDDNYQILDNLNDFYEYDVSTGAWTRKSDFPGTGRKAAASFSTGGKGYIGFGQSLVNCDQNCEMAEYKDLWEYDPISDHWELVGTYDQVPEGLTGYSRAYDINGKVYITLGYELWVFDSADRSFTMICELPDRMLLTTGFTINGKIYLGTGGTPELSKAFYEYDPSSDIWTRKADLAGKSRRFASAFAFKGKGYISCGAGSVEISPGYFQTVGLTDTWSYDPGTDSWTRCNDYPGAAFIHQVSSNSDKYAVVGTGETGKDIFYGRDYWMVK